MFEDVENKDAAQILRGLKKRVEDIEQERESEGFVNFLRSVQDTAHADDTVSATEDSSPGFVWDSDNWDFCEWQ